MAAKVSVAAKAFAAGGEGPIWDHRTNQLYWLDIAQQQLHSHNPATGENTTAQLPLRISRLFLMGETDFAAAVPGGIARLYMENRIWKAERLITLDADPDILSNDGECDSRGRIVLGLMHKEFLPGRGSLHICSGRNSACFARNLKVPNGVAWSADERELFVVTNQPTAGLLRYAYDVATGEVGALKEFIEFPQADGMCADENGNLWIVRVSRGQVVCFDPRTKQIIDQVKIPVSTTTSCAFGGEHMDTLFVTTATWGNSVPQFPDRGSLFKVENMKVRGRKANCFQW